MRLSLQVWLVLRLVLCCCSHPIENTKNSTEITTPGPVVKTTVKDKADSNQKKSSISHVTSSTEQSSKESDFDKPDENGIAHIIKHSKLFTEFVSFTINPAKTVELPDFLRNGFLAELPIYSEEIKDSKENITLPENKTMNIEPNKPNFSALQQLFVEMAKRNSPGVLMSFDYLNVTSKAAPGKESTSRVPVRLWGIVPDEGNNKTVYFIGDLYSSLTAVTETKKSAKEQLDDFEVWKNENILKLGEFNDDKLGDGTIGALLG